MGKNEEVYYYLKTGKNEEVYYYLKTATIRNITSIYGICVYIVFAYIYLACLRFLIHENRVLHFLRSWFGPCFARFKVIIIRKKPVLGVGLYYKFSHSAV